MGEPKATTFMAGSIFFSYSRKDSEFVLSLAQELREAGADIWLDQLDIEPGTAWDDSIEDALAKSDTLLVVLSKTSVTSTNVRDEYSYAIEEGKRVVPVLMEPCTVPFRLRRLQYADFTQDRQVGIDTLTETLGLSPVPTSKRSTPITPAPKPIEDTTPKIKSQGKQKSGKDKLYMILGIVILSAIAYYAIGFLLPDKTPDQITVLVHQESGKDQLVLPNRGEVTLIYGDANVVETINSKGEATFKQIPEQFFEEDARVEIRFADPQGEPYRAVEPDSLYQVGNNSYISLAVKLYGLEEVYGIVKDFSSGDPIPEVRISISGEETYSNEFGEYRLSIPTEKQQQFQTIRAYKEGYQLFELQDVPVQTNTELPIVLKVKS